MALCSTYLQIFAKDLSDQWRTDNNGDRYYQRPFPLDDLLRKGAEAACFICTHVYDASKASRHPWIRVVSELEPATKEQPCYRLTINFASEGDHPDRTEWLGPRFVIQPDNHEADIFGTAATQTSFTGSEEHMRLAHHWLSNCLDTPSECAKNRRPTRYPARLLRTEELNVRLIETAAHNLSEPYATLSHCWGGEPFECLTDENRNAFENGLPRTSLPPTFRDALLAAEKTGIYLIWIDSYCIIQSSKSVDATFNTDKMAEIARMKDVYANATVNIGASHGIGPQSGCFVQREQLQTEPRRFQWQSRSGEEEVFCIRGWYASRHMTALFSHQGLFKRGWVMQERLLTPRMLHFTDKQLYWECAGLGLASELYPEGMSEYGPKSNPTIAWPPFTLEQAAKDTFDMWDSVVRGYSHPSLTWPAQDKLPAVGAVAAVMAEKTNDMYVAGLFRRELLPSLCWRTLIKPDEGVHRIRDTSTPSWSWASVDCRVGHKGLSAEDEPMAFVDDVHVQLRDPSNAFGAVDSGTITIRGRLLRTTIAPNDRTCPYKQIRLNTDIEGVLDEDHFGFAFTSLEEFDELALSSIYFMPLYWALDYLPKLNGQASIPTRLEDALVVDPAEREAFYKMHRIHGRLLVQQPDLSFKRLYMLLSTPAKLPDAWNGKEIELISLV